LEELIRDFDLSKVGKAGAKFDPDKARWYNHQFVQATPDEVISSQFIDILREKDVNVEVPLVNSIVKLVKERVNFVSEIWDQAYFFFEAPSSYDEKMVKKRWKENSPSLMASLMTLLDDCEPFTAESIEEKVKLAIEENEWGMGAVMSGWRILLVGTSMGPGMFDIAEVLGKEEVLDRMQKGITSLK